MDQTASPSERKDKQADTRAFSCIFLLGVSGAVIELMSFCRTSVLWFKRVTAWRFCK